MYIILLSLILGAYLITFLGNRCGDIPPFVLKSATQVCYNISVNLCHYNYLSKKLL